MSTRQQSIPGPNHPITIEVSPKHFVVKTNGRVVADGSTATLTLREAAYPAVQYFRWPT